jgi:membrane associated rhomboid family serine protease
VIIPYGTDAPVYHFPWATLGVIALTTAILVATGPIAHLDPTEVEREELESQHAGAAAPAGPGKAAPADDDVREEYQDTDEDHEQRAKARWVIPLMLYMGRGVHPLQWVTANFLHADWLHLIFNMLFLWCFGIVVEGKLGWWKFLALYVGIGAAGYGTVQLLTLAGGGGYAIGASLPIYGLLAAALIWAPKNDLHCLVYFAPRHGLCGLWDIPIIWLCGLYVFIEAVTVLFMGFRVSTPFLHLMGAVWGMGAAVLLLRMDWVDCEGWDLFAVLQRRQGEASLKKRKRRRKRARDEGAEDSQANATTASDQLRRAIAEGHTAAALALYQKTQEGQGAWPAGELELVGLIKLLQTQQMWNESVPVMEEFVHRFPRSEKAPRVRLKLAQVLLRYQERPVQALRELAELPPGSLPADLEPVRHQVERKAIQLRDEGVLELEGGNW